MSDQINSSHPPIGASVARGGLWEITAQVVPQLYVVIQSIFIARYLGPTGVGRIALIALVSYVGSTLFTLGVPTALLRFTGRLIGEGRGGDANALYRWTMRVESAAAGLVFALMALAGFLGATPSGAWVFAGIVGAGSVMNAVSSSFLRGLMQYRRARVIGIVSGSFDLVAKVVALALGGGITVLFALEAVTVVANVIGTELLARRAARTLKPLPATPPELRPMLRFAGVGSINLFISLIVYQRTEVFFLAHYSTTTQVAIYSIPFSIVTALLLIPRAIGYALAPAIATLWGAGEIERVRLGFARTTRILLLTVIMITAVAVAFAPTGIRLVYGRGFAGAGPIVVILTVTLPFVPLQTVSSALLLGMGRQWGLTIIGFVAAVFNIGLDWLLIPPFAAVGAAAANSTAQLLGSIPLIIYAIRVIGGVSLHFASLLRGIVVALVAVLAAQVPLYTLPSVFGFVVGLLVFAVTLLLGCLLLRPVPADDGVWVDETLGGWANGLVGLACRRFSPSLPVAPSHVSP